MGDTNFFSGIVKILENPVPTVSNGKISVAKFRVELPQIRNKNKMIYLTFWGNLAHDIGNLYQINDYIIVEGYLSVRNKKNKNFPLTKEKKLEIAVLKVYPFLFSSNRPINKVSNHALYRIFV
jgi:hypothetical protein